jgi:hypothetical protein
MASVLYQYGQQEIYQNDIDMETANLDALLIGNTTECDTDHDAVSVADFSPLDECDDSTYAHEDVTNAAVSVDNTDNEMVWTSDNWVWSGLTGDGTNPYQGALLVLYVDGGTSDIPILFVDFTADVPNTATQVTAQAPAEGFLNIGQPA